jgi:hypothetical protein
MVFIPVHKKSFFGRFSIRKFESKMPDFYCMINVIKIYVKNFSLFHSVNFEEPTSAFYLGLKQLSDRIMLTKQATTTS